MKQVVSMMMALLLAAGLTACGNSVSQMVDDAEREVAEYRGNVSTTNDGRVNGTNPSKETDRSDYTSRTNPSNYTTRTDRTGRSAVRPMPGTANTDSMGAGMR